MTGLTTVRHAWVFLFSNLLIILPDGSDMQWQPRSVSQGRQRSRSSCEHSSDCWEQDPHTLCGSAAGSDAWSLISSDNDQVGEKHKESKSGKCLFLLRSYYAIFSVLKDKNIQDWLKREWLTCPLSSIRLLVSLRVSKDTVCFIHWPPQAGESGWKCILLGAMTSARPATNQDELWKAYLTHTHAHCLYVVSM